MVILCELLEEEKQTINILVEKKNALFNLKKILDQNTPMFFKCCVEFEKVEKEYLRWWDDMTQKYKLVYNCEEKLYVNCEEGCILKEN